MKNKGKYTLIFQLNYEGYKYKGWAEFITYGGLPLTVTMKTEEQKILGFAMLDWVSDKLKKRT